MTSVQINVKQLKSKIMNTLTREEALRIIKSKASNTITEPGSYRLKVTNDTKNLESLNNPAVTYEIAEGYSQLSIANFNAITPYQLKEALALVKEGRYDDAANKGLSYGITNKSHYPVKGERVMVEVDYVELKSGETALLVDEITKIAPSQAKSLSMEAIEAMLAGGSEDTAPEVEATEEDVENMLSKQG